MFHKDKLFNKFIPLVTSLNSVDEENMLLLLPDRDSRAIIRSTRSMSSGSNEQAMLT